ncbi:Cysteine protease [Phytophthora nicotianae]|uniref:Cysteine protease n=1 Tax=Phytophthora nicotianae TaxID=4792 RepID=A0A0W8CMK5_PHYNI|nr:Cysteine protease [Phytophthora nicotianae]
MASATKKRVSYFYHPEEGHFYYGPGHPMKPHRMKLAHHLVVNYDLYRKMDIFEPHIASAEEIKAFHAPDYIDFLQKISPSNQKDLTSELQKYNLGELTDCPVFDGIFDFCQIYSGGTLDADIGTKNGKYYAVNFPLLSGMNDESYESVFKPVIQKVMETFCPFGLPMLVLGGGGYTIRNVSRAWAYETSILLDEEVSNNIPYNDYFEFYAPNFKLHLEPDLDLENANSKEYLDECKDDKDQRGNADDGADASASTANGSVQDEGKDNTAPDVIPMDVD